jgi:DNA-binding MarR family transcriptional regulator
MSKSHNASELEDAYRFFNEIGIIAQLSANQMQRTLPHNLTLSQFSVLNWFSRVDAKASPGRLARAFQVSKGAMTNTLHKLSDKEFITIEEDPDSGRSKIVRMTPAGANARKAAIAASHPLLEDFLDRFDQNQITELLPLLQDIRSHLDRLRENS